jgi:serine/threonine-protein kinase
VLKFFQVRSDYLSMETLAKGSSVGGKYVILELLGKGGMGEVYHARHVQVPEFHVALKVLDPALTAHVENKERFRNEVIAGYRVNHPHVVQMYEYFDLGELQAFAMEFVEGSTLLEVMHDGPLPLDVAVSFMKQMALGLGALHRVGTVHRDLKPENVLVSTTGHLRLTDFGIARIRGSSRLELEDLLEGTPAYVPPEYVERKESDHRGDIYALGVIGYEMLAGALPFRATTNTALLKERLTPHGLDLAERSPETPRALVAIVERCLAVQPQQRFPQAHDLVEVLRALQGSLGLADTVPCEPRQRETRLVWGETLKSLREGAPLSGGAAGGAPTWQAGGEYEELS